MAELYAQNAVGWFRLDFRDSVTRLPVTGLLHNSATYEIEKPGNVNRVAKSTVSGDWLEIVPVGGGYQLRLTTGDTDTVGPCALWVTINSKSVRWPFTVVAASSVDLSPVQTVVNAIKTKTDNLPATPASQGDVTTVGTAVSGVGSNVTAVKAKTDNLPASPANETTVAAVKAKTDNLPASPANETTVAAVKSKTDLIPAVPASQGDVTTVGSAVTGVGSNVTAVKAKTDNLPASPASTGDVTTARDVVTAILGTPAGDSLADDISNLDVDTSTLALEATAQSIKDKTDLIPAQPATAGNITTSQAAIIAAIDDIEVDTTGLALESSVQAVKAKTDIIPSTLATDIAAILLRVKMASGENVVKDTFTYGDGLTGHRTRLYNNATNAALKGSTGVQLTLLETMEYVDEEQTQFECIVKVLV